jgi:hypothetical protein
MKSCPYNKEIYSIALRFYSKRTLTYQYIYANELNLTTGLSPENMEK